MHYNQSNLQPLWRYQPTLNSYASEINISVCVVEFNSCGAALHKTWQYLAPVGFRIG